MDASKEIRRAADTGRVFYGYRQTERSVLKGDGKLVIVSRNLPCEQEERLRHIAALSGIPVYAFEGTALQLGSVCGKPFPVSVMLVADAGKSAVDALAEKEGGGKAVEKKERGEEA